MLKYFVVVVFVQMFTLTIPSTRRERERHEDTVRELGLVTTVQKRENRRPRVTLSKQFIWDGVQSRRMFLGFKAAQTEIASIFATRGGSGSVVLNSLTGVITITTPLNSSECSRTCTRTPTINYPLLATLCHHAHSPPHWLPLSLVSN